MENNIKSINYNCKTKETAFEYFTEEELKEIQAIEEEKALEDSLKPSKEEIENAEFELKLLEKLTDWGVIL